MTVSSGSSSLRVPEWLMRRRLYLDFTGYKRDPAGMQASNREIVPAFQTVREKGLNMIDASELQVSRTI